MDILILLIPIALGLGLLALAAFMWALRSGQFDDPEGASNRILFDDEPPYASAAHRQDAESAPAVESSLENDHHS